MRILILIFSISISIYAKSYLLSSLNISKSEVIDLSTTPCSQSCLNQYLINGEIFSFLAKYNKEVYDTDVKNKFLMYSSIFNLEKEILLDINIAVLFPQKMIGKYALSTTKSILSYLLAKDVDFSIETFDTKNETVESMQKIINSLKEKEIKHIIAITTANGANNLASVIDENQIVFIPTVNVRDTDINSTNIYFGGIDYKAQVDRLFGFANRKVTVLHDQSSVSKNITNYIENKHGDSNQTMFFKKSVKSDENFKRLIKYNRDINYATIFLNTPVISSSLILSQLTFYEKIFHRVLSTQINYNPLILSLTQIKDRKKLVLVNSISDISDSKIADYNKLLGSDVVYDWINYSSLLGADYMYGLITKENSSIFKEKIYNNQIHYNTKLVRPTNDKFIQIGP